MLRTAIQWKKYLINNFLRLGSDGKELAIQSIHVVHFLVILHICSTAERSSVVLQLTL